MIKNSALLNTEYLCKYTNPSPVKLKQVEGFKLVLYLGNNYYSIGTGLHRYLVGESTRLQNNYSVLYKNTPYWCEYMKDRIAIFSTIEDINLFYPNWKDTNHACVINIVLEKELMALTAENEHTKCKVYAGKEIVKIKKL
jgi:hypothetical protein